MENKQGKSKKMNPQYTKNTMNKKQNKKQRYLYDVSTALFGKTNMMNNGSMSPKTVSIRLRLNKMRKIHNISQILVINIFLFFEVLQKSESS